MKLNILISALAITSLPLAAQDILALPDANEINPNSVRIYPNPHENHSDNNKLVFINCWIHPMDASINSEFPEYTPVFNEREDIMFFTSRRPGNIGNRKTIDPIYKAEDIYFSTKDPKGKWSTAVQLVGKVNSFKNEAVTWVSENGMNIILCQNEDLFQSSFVNGAWTKPEPMTALNSDYRETHASFSPDGNTIYFTTENPDLATVGGLDICKVERDPSGEWKKPVIVEGVNSAMNEEDPTLMKDGKTLYFSSEGFGTLGGYDIFKATMKNDKSFGDPVNLGFPLNTEANEPFMTLTRDGVRAYLSSDRGEGGEQNIYELIFPDMIKIPLLVEVYDAETKEFINSNVKLIDLKQEGKEIYMDNESAGVFGTNEIAMNSFFSLTAEAKDHESQVIEMNTNGLKEFDPDTFRIIQKVYLQPIKKSEPEIVHPEIHHMDKVVHFEYGKFTLTPHSEKIVNKIQEFLLANPSATIVIHAHTDNKGSNESNMKLSQNRANAVKNWFVQKGIDPNRIMIQSYGETKPVMDNDSDDHRAKNRRAEIEIIY
jgi:outer membrane protein OmpA-like peptidoglycan-associated protein